jgi:NADH-quinone oxidoreductase subunit H
MEGVYDFRNIINSVNEGLIASFGATWGEVMGWVIVATIFMALFALLGLILVYVERKVAAFFQQRLGPMRVGFWGTAQTVADALKLLLKEPLVTKSADKMLFNMAPFVIIITALLAMAVLPFGNGLQAFDINIGLLFITAVSSIGVVGILLAGWSSNNKYSLIGAMRSGAQIISYELSVGLSLITMMILTESMQLSTIVESQADGWFIFKGHIPAVIAFVLFIISATAETNRGPFDLAEAESELTAGFHTEYSGMKFAFFFLGEFVNMFIAAAIATTVFFGGWMPFHIAGMEGFNSVMDYVPQLVWFFGKVSVIVFLMMWFKWTFPRLRIDQLLVLEWKYLMPLNLMNLMLMALLVYFGLVW